MSHEEEKGATKQVKGELREAAGVLTDNREMQAKGKLEKTEGKAQEKIGHMKAQNKRSRRRRHLNKKQILFAQTI
jgi:uncharacterized protein YjbJ (UPF0337 family)